MVLYENVFLYERLPLYLCVPPIGNDLKDQGVHRGGRSIRNRKNGAPIPGAPLKGEDAYVSEA